MGCEPVLISGRHEVSCSNFPVRCHRSPRMGRESRTGRGVPARPAGAQRPVEEAVLALTGSERLMGLASKAARREQVKG